MNYNEYQALAMRHFDWLKTEYDLETALEWLVEWYDWATTQSWK